MEQTKYDVFISYSRADYLDDRNNIISGSAVERIIKTLEEYGIKYWIDIDGDNANSQYIAKITKAIDSSDFILYVSSRNSNGKDSFWPIKEISLAGEKHKRIIPIKIDRSDFNENIRLILAGLDIIEYHKNETSSLQKLVKMLTGNIITVPTPIQDVFRGIAIFISIVLLIATSAFLVFGSIGFCVGYWGAREKADVLLDDAISSNRLIIVDQTTIRYSGKIVSFTYDLNNDIVDFDKGDQSLLDNISVESIIMSVSLPFMFEKLFSYAEHSGNGRTKIAIIIGGSIGILCGYSVGNYVGKDYALSKNDEEISEYLKNKETKGEIRHYIDIYYHKK